ncbi:MAG: endo-1,4-beta-xylanase [Phocaeicola sp.]
MRRYKFLLPLSAAALLLLPGCYEEKMEWGKPDGHGDVSLSEIPLTLMEKIANYKTIKEYAQQYTPEMIVGAGIGADLYISDEQFKQVADENYQMFTTGNAMKHSSVVNNRGELVFTTIDAFFEAIPANMPVYGHTFVWHTQQRASYLNGIIAPDVIIVPDETDVCENIIRNSDFEEGTITPWNSWGNGSSRSISAQGDGFESDYALLLTNPDNANSYSAQAVYDLSTTLEAGVTYVFQFMARSSVAGGQLQVQVQNSTSYGSQEGYHTFDVGTSWVLCQSEFTATYDDADRVIINFGAVASNYHIDNFKFGKKIEAPTLVNIVDNSSFEDGTTNPWSSWGNSSSRAISAQGDGFESDYAMVLTNPTDADNWSAQAAYGLLTPLEEGATYQFQFMARSTTPGGKLQVQVQNSDTYGSQQGYSTFDVGTSWMLYESEFTASFDDINRLLINFGAVASDYYIDNFKFGKKSEQPAARSIASRSMTVIEKTPEEKRQIITDAMENWISSMMEHCRGRVKMWDVMNEVVADNGKLRGVEEVPAEVGDQEFYWGQYMGKEYGVKAFQFARQYGNVGDQLFINDYNLESNPNKLAVMIDYVNYIDQTNGAPIVDGLGTQMHVTTSITREQVDAMFKTMAATGKLVRITELDVQVGTLTPSTDQLAKQAETYQMIIESYKEHVPTAQRSGVTIWSLTDHPDEHEYWLPGDSPNLFDKNFGRKHAYKGVCDALAGFDISTEFTGEDWENK